MSHLPYVTSTYILIFNSINWVTNKFTELHPRFYKTFHFSHFSILGLFIIQVVIASRAKQEAWNGPNLVVMLFNNIK